MALREMYMNQIHCHKKCKYSTSNINHSITVLITKIFPFKNVGHKVSKTKKTVITYISISKEGVENLPQKDEGAQGKVRDPNP